MKNKDYNILGKIISVITNDYPSQVSKNFSDKVMDKIILHNKNNHKKISYNYLNIAASVFFAIITTYSLVNYNEFDPSLSPIISKEVEKEENSLIKRVIDKNPCETIENSNDNDNENENDKCK